MDHPYGILDRLDELPKKLLAPATAADQVDARGHLAVSCLRFLEETMNNLIVIRLFSLSTHFGLCWAQDCE